MHPSETYPRLALAVDIFHIFWVLLFLAMPFAPDKWGIWKRLPITVTLISQVVFLGCPLVVLSSKLRGSEFTYSFTIVMLKSFGIAIHEWQIVAILALITVATFGGFNYANH